MSVLWFIQWMPEVRHHCPSAAVVLVGTQTDLRDDRSTIASLAEHDRRPISHETGEKLAKKLKAACYVECSAVTQVGYCMTVVAVVRRVFCAKLTLQVLYMLRQIRPSVCLSVCPSHSGVVSKRGNAEECGLHHRVVHCL